MMMDLHAQVSTPAIARMLLLTPLLQILMSVQAKMTDVNTHVLIRMDPMSAIVLLATV